MRESVVRWRHLLNQFWAYSQQTLNDCLPQLNNELVKGQRIAKDDDENDDNDDHYHDFDYDGSEDDNNNDDDNCNDDDNNNHDYKDDFI